MQNAIRMFTKLMTSDVDSVSVRGGLLDGDNVGASGTGREMKNVIRDGVCYVRLCAIYKYGTTKGQGKSGKLME